jgi:probable F420-dependent oxidoreductase
MPRDSDYDLRATRYRVSVMKIGINLINFGPGVTPESLSRSTELAESLGYHLVMISDHVAITPDVRARYPAPFYDPFTTLGWLAGLTRRIELGTTVIILPYRHPLLTARMAANLDRLSGGRLILGVGVGWARQEFEALGLPFQQRGAMSNEYLAVIKLAWTEDPASYTGRFVSFTDIQTAPGPLRVPHPPIWIGGGSDAALSRAVNHGQAWHPIRIRVGWLRDTGLPRLRAIAKAAGKALPALCPRIRLRLTDSPLADDDRVAGEGNLDQVRADLAALEGLGAEYVLLDTYADDPEATRRPEIAWRMFTTLAEQVLDLPRQTLR